jgi:hypothetical protein
VVCSGVRDNGLFLDRSDGSSLTGECVFFFRLTAGEDCDDSKKGFGDDDDCKGFILTVRSSPWS